MIAGFPGATTGRQLVCGAACGKGIEVGNET
jgi:hypothetical protein